MIKDFQIRLDLINKVVNNIFEVVSRDENGNVVTAIITKNSMAADLTGAAITVIYKNPVGGTLIQNDAVLTSLSSGRFEFTIPLAVMQIAGKVSAEIVISIGDTTLTTESSFSFTVRTGLGDEPGAVPIPEIPQWEEALSLVNDRIDELDLTGGAGVDGEDAFVYVAYSSDANGTGFTMTFNSALDYIAIKSTNTAIVTPVVGDFAGLWKNYKGAPGSQGVPGNDGPVGPAGTTDHTMLTNTGVKTHAELEGDIADIMNPIAADVDKVWTANADGTAEFKTATGGGSVDLTAILNRLAVLEEGETDMQATDKQAIYRAMAWDTYTLLAANATFTGLAIDGIALKRVTGKAASSQDGSIKIYHSNSTTFSSTPDRIITLTGGSPVTFDEPFYLRHMKVDYLNGATLQTSFGFSGYVSAE